VLVVGATYPEELKNIRLAHPDMPILIPGVGAQGGDLELSVRYGIDAHNRGIMINSSRGNSLCWQRRGFLPCRQKSAQTLERRYQQSHWMELRNNNQSHYELHSTRRNLPFTTL